MERAYLELERRRYLATARLRLVRAAPIVRPVPTAVTLRCDGCGAPLPAPGGRVSLTCSYCHRELVVRAGATAVQADSEARSTTDTLLRGYTGVDVGTGERYTAGDRPDWSDPARTLWPTSATASSDFGGGWSAGSLCGPPRVFPAHGDRSGSWAPRTRASQVEWVEVGFPPPAPAARRVRVFETNLPGATFAVALIRGDGSARTEEIIWQRAPSLLGSTARILEVDLPRSERVDRVRVYVANDLGSSWSELDTVGLVTVEPVPVELRQRAPSRWRARGCMVLIAAGLAAGGLYAWSSAEVPIAPPPAELRDGQGLMVWNVDRVGMAEARVMWASRLAGVSSEFSASRNAARQALGPPDVHPAHADLPGAWASLERDRGLEHLEVGFGEPILASAIVIVETFNPGALARIEDVSEGQPPTLLWEGTTPSADHARVLSLDLPTPRPISAVRLVLDTTRAAGWNEIDAVGLVPAPAR